MRNGKQIKHCDGFTLIELLVVLAIVALLLTVAQPRYFKSIERAKEAALRQDLDTLRDGIDKFYADTGQYPDSLESLKERHYINKLPIDPITESSETWVLISPESPLEGGVYDVKSGAMGEAKDGSLYADW
jgi:general secretion pathway protein G